MSEEMTRILKMVEEGKITAQDAKELIDALGAPTTEIGLAKKYEDKFLKVKVLSSEGDKVNVQLPVKVIKEIIKATGKLPIETNGMHGVNLDEIMDTVIRCLDNEVMGEIVDVESASGDSVKIVIE